MFLFQWAQVVPECTSFALRCSIVMPVFCEVPIFFVYAFLENISAYETRKYHEIFGWLEYDAV